MAGIKRESIDSTMEETSTVSKRAKMPPNPFTKLKRNDNAEHFPPLQPFTNETILRRVFAHKGLPSSNEVLALIGDALISFCVASWLHQRKPGWTKGRITNARSAIHRTASLAQWSADYGLPQLLRCSDINSLAAISASAAARATVFQAYVGGLEEDLGFDVAKEWLCSLLDVAAVAHLSDDD